MANRRLAPGDPVVVDVRRRDGSVRRKTKRTKGAIVGIVHTVNEDGTVNVTINGGYYSTLGIFRGVKVSPR